MEDYYYVDSKARFHYPSSLREATQTVLSTSALFTNTHSVVESVDQHKYARLAMSSYYRNQPEKIDELLNALPETESLAIVEELSKPQHSVFHNANTGETVVSFRGTTTLEDIATDGKLLASKELTTERFKESEALVEDVIERFGKENLSVGIDDLTIKLELQEVYESLLDCAL